MRLVHALVPNQYQSDVFAYLEGEGIDYIILTQDSETDAVVVEFPLPTSAVEEVLDYLNAAGLRDEYTVVTSAETVEARNFERLEDRYVEREDKDIAPAELRTRAVEMGQRTAIYYTMTLLSAMVAAAGLLLDDPTLVVGSMVIAPQVGSALEASVGTVFDDRSMIVEGLRSQLLGLLLAIIGAAAFGLFIQWLGVGPTRLSPLVLEQVYQRVSPGVLAVVVAVAAGIAAAFSLATAVPTSLVGVMIAAALIPAAAAVGIGLAWNEPMVAIGAAVLLTVNTAAINLTAIGGLRSLGYHISDDNRRDTERPRRPDMFRPAMVAVLVLSLALAGSGYFVVQHVEFERTATDSVSEVLSAPEYDRLALLRVETQFGQSGALDGPGKVTVIIKRPPDTVYPDLAGSLQRRLAARMDRPIAVDVEFRETANAGTPA